MGAYDQIPLDQQSPKRVAQESSPAEPSGTQHFGQIKEDKHSVDLHLDKRETRGPTHLFNDADKQAPTLASATQQR
jgi:hypothetical protein